MNNKDTFFTAQDPWTSRDYVPEPQDPFQPGSHEWCKAYVPWGEGLTFDMILWQRACDTDNDGKYGCGDVTIRRIRRRRSLLLLNNGATAPF